MAEAAASGETIREIVLFLGTAGVIIPLVKRLKLSPTLGFLLAGILLGPFVMGRLSQTFPLLRYVSIPNAEEIGHVGEFGVVFLFFMIGLELSLERLRILRRLVLSYGAGQFLISTAAIGLFAWFWGQQAIASLVIGAALAMSSTAIVIPALAERRKLGTPSGRTTFAVLLFQDLAVTPLLVMLSLMATTKSGAVDQAGALWTLLQAAIGLALIIGLGRILLKPLFHSVALAKDPEFFMAASLLVVLGAAFLAQMTGLSMAIGAFVGGILLAETEFRRQIEATIDPFRGLLLGLFFIAIGARLDLALLFESPLPILGMVAAFVGIKIAILYGILSRSRMPAMARHEAAWLLAPGGEFGFVLLSSAIGSGLIWPSIGNRLMVAVTVSMFCIPFIAMALDRLANKSAAPPAEFDDVDDTADEAPVVVIGCGRVGSMVADLLAEHKVPAFSVDSNQRAVALARAEGRRAYFGDPTAPAFMERLHLEDARALVLTVGSPAAVDAIAKAARAIAPGLTIVARARDENHAQHLYEVGITDAVPETFEASLQLAEAVLVDVGVPMGLVIASVHERRDIARKGLQEASGVEVRKPQAVRRRKQAAGGETP